jgi:hypothetical protein
VDDLPPHGIRRPVGDLPELDDVGAMCLDARTVVRAWIAAAKDRAAMWGLPPCPPVRRPDPATTSPGRGDRRPI